MKLTSKQVAYLKSQAHHLQPVFQVGKSGLTEEGMTQIKEALEKRELIKIHLLQNTGETIEEVAKKLETRIGATIVQKIGKTLVLFKMSKNVKNRVISSAIPN